MIKTKPDYMQFSKDELQAYRRRFAKLWDAIPHLTADIEDEEERQALLLVLFLHSLLHAPFGVFSAKNKVSLIDFIDIVPEQSEEMRKVFAQAGGGAIRRIALEKAQKVLELYGFYPTPKAKAPVLTPTASEVRRESLIRDLEEIARAYFFHFFYAVGRYGWEVVDVLSADPVFLDCLRRAGAKAFEFKCPTPTLLSSTLARGIALSITETTLTPEELNNRGADSPVPRRLFLGKDSHGRARTATFSHLDEDGYARYAIDTNAGNTGLS